MKTYLKKLFLPCMLLTFVFSFMLTSRVNAYGLVQTNPKANSITVQWNAESDATKYTIYVGTGYSDLKQYAEVPSTSTSATISGLSAGHEYCVKVDYTYPSSYGTNTYTSSVGSDYFRTTPGKVTGVKQDKWWYILKCFDVKWDEQDSADEYEYIVKNNKGKKKASGKVSYESLSVYKISNSTVYTVKVRACSTINGKKYTGAWSAPCYCFTQPRINSARVKGGKLTVKWGKVAGATGYDIYVSTKPKKGYKKVKSVGKNSSSATISKLKGKKYSSKKTYYVYVVTKKKVKGRTNTSGRLYYWNTKNTSYDYF